MTTETTKLIEEARELCSLDREISAKIDAILPTFCDPRETQLLGSGLRHAYPVFTHDLQI